MPFKMDGDNVVMQDGLPVYIGKDGKESPFNADAALDNLNKVTGESIARKEKIKALEDAALPFAGIENASEWVTGARKAMDTVANLKDKEIVDAGEIERLKRGVAESFETKIKELEKGFTAQLGEKDALITGKDNAVRNLLIRGAFDGSKFIGENTVLTAGIAYSEFGKNFDIEEVDGKPVAVGKRGNEKIFSSRNPGSYALPDEVIEILVNEHPDKDSILKGLPGGGGSPPGGGKGSAGNGKTISRSQYDAMQPAARRSHFKDGGTITE